MYNKKVCTVYFHHVYIVQHTYFKMTLQKLEYDFSSVLSKLLIYF